MNTTELIKGTSGARAVLRMNSAICDGLCDDVVQRINEIITHIGESLRITAGKLVSRARDRDIYKITLEFFVLNDGNNVSIERRLAVDKTGRRLAESTGALKFEIVYEKYIKPVKNGKKQRFIPSRNSENVTKRKNKANRSL